MSCENGVFGVRGFHREIGIFRFSQASYHLDYLEELRLSVKERGDYRLVAEVRVGIIEQLIKPSNFMLPRRILYGFMFTTLLILFGLANQSI
jgi:hypothetical protein